MSISIKGFPSKSSYVLNRYYERKMSLSEIHRESGIKYGAIASIISQHRKEIGSPLKRAATIRGISLHALKQQLIDVIERDDLVEAILDDLDEREARKQSNGHAPTRGHEKSSIAGAA